MKTKQAIRRAGSGKALAELLGVTPSAVSQYGKELPTKRDQVLREKRPAWYAEKPAPSDTTAPPPP